MANLLGTPSLSPQSKKSTDGGSTKSKETAPPQEANPSAETHKSSAKEPSKLRSGWDAVTSFFGIQSSTSNESKTEEKPSVSEPVVKQSAPASREPRSEAKPAAGGRGGKKGGKPSFWTDDAEKAVEPVESKPKQAAAPIQSDVFASTDDEPVVSFGGRRRERNDRKENSRSPRESRESTNDKNDTPRQTNNPLPSPTISASLLESDDVDGPVERRSQRRAPRRGRSDDLDEGAVEAQPARSVAERREPAPSRRSRSAETARSSEAVRPAETAREDGADEPVNRSEESRGSDRPSRGGRDRSGRDRPPRNRPERERPERTERAERPERAEREIVDRDPSDREEPIKDTPERESGRRGRDRRSRNDETRNAPERRRPEAARRAPVDEVGFGAGVADSEDDEDFVALDDESSDSVEGETSERSSDGPRRGRNQRRGRRTSGRTATSADDAERMEADESEKKFIKVPSWIEALDGILQSNMDNHQRNNHGRDRNRSRGPRNNDR